MKATCIVFILIGLLIGCQQKTVQPPEVDAATLVAGRYELTKATAFGNDGGATDFYKPHSSLVLTRMTATSVKATFTLPTGTSPFDDTWTLKKVSDDTVEIRGQGLSVDGYNQGKIGVFMGDGSLSLWFQQVK